MKRNFKSEMVTGRKSPLCYCLGALMFVALIWFSKKNRRQEHTITHHSYYEPNYFEKMKKFLFETGANDGKQAIGDLLRDGLITAVQSEFYNNMFLQRYDKVEDLETSGGPKADQELCLSQLNQLIARAKVLEGEKFKSKDININLLLDSFGRAPSGILQGDIAWLGSYDQCSGLQIKLNNITQSATRYCVSSLRLTDWPGESQLDRLLAFKQAVCLPKACDSINYKNKYQLVQQLAEFNARRFDIGSYNLTDLYCLPDEDSTLRMWWLNPASVICLCAVSIWFLLLGFATIKYQKLTKIEDGGLADSNWRIYQSLSIIHNLKNLLNTTPTKAVSFDAKRVNCQAKQADLCGERIDKIAHFNQKEPVVDLRVLDGCKVLCMIYITLAHIVLCHSIMIQNEWNFITSKTFQLLNSAPAFAVNSFFTITGLLTSYTHFKENKIIAKITKPAIWVSFVINRYVRIMPAYVVVVMYAKYLAKFAGSGPLWDYGTSSLGKRLPCEQESWLWTLLFAANFKPPMDHCVISAWYLANDFQFAILTPLFLFLLYKKSKIGKMLIAMCIFASFTLGFIGFYTAEIDDLRPISEVLPFAFRYLDMFSVHIYTQPQYRISAYLIGLLVGLSLRNFEQAKLKWLAEQQQVGMNHQQLVTGSHGVFNRDANKNIAREEPNWPWWLIKFGPIGCACTIAVFCLGPFIQFDLGKSAARIEVAFIVPGGHVLFSAAVGVYLLLATTGQGCRILNKSLSMSLWKPFSRLSCCAVIINCEILMWLVQSNTQTQYFNTQFHNSLSIYYVIVTYMVALLLYVLFEAPMRTVINLILANFSGSKSNKE